MPLYRAEVSVDDIDVIGPAPSSDPSFLTRAALWFAVFDRFNRYGLGFRVQWNSFGGGPTFEYQSASEGYFRASGGLDPWDWDLVPGTSLEEADGLNGSAYFAGGTLAIEKDTEAETVTFITPLGSVTKTWAELEALGLGLQIIDASPLQAAGMGHQFDKAGGDPQLEEAHWFDFFSSQDGEVFHGHELSASDPGVWTFWIEDPVYGGSGTYPETDNVQEANRYQTQHSWTLADDTPDFRQDGAREIRYWDGDLFNRGVDFVDGPDHLTIWRAGAQPYKPHVLRWGRTHDHGRRWTGGTIVEEVGKTWSSPSLTYWNGRLNVVWTDGTDFYQSFSITGGQTWSEPVTLPFTGTHPRHIRERTSGFACYFFFDGADLMVARSTDDGATFLDAAPIEVYASAGAQQIDAEFAFDGSVFVGFFESGAWRQRRSRNLGLTWDD